MNRLLQSLVAASLAQPLLVCVALIGLVLAGVMSWRQLPIDAFPDISSTQVKIVMKAPGMTPEEVESRIVVPIELEMLGIPNQTILRSQSKYAIADITMDFAEGTDVYWARQQVTERLSGVLGSLPANVTGGVAPMTTPLGEMFMFTIEGPQSLAERRAMLDWTVRPALRNVPGVADVNALGGFVESMEVVPEPAAMAVAKVSFAQLRQAIEANNRNDGAGRISLGEESMVVRTGGAIRDLDAMRRVPVTERDGIVVRVGDLAQVRTGALTRYGLVTQDGEGEAVEGLVLGMRGANARQLVTDVRARLEEIGSRLPQGASIRIFYDRGELVARAVYTVQKALVEAIAIVVVLLLLFLGNVRAALTVALVLPLSALATFVLMHAFGLSANLMSLGGLVIAIGMLIDAAVVVVENIEAHAGEPMGAHGSWLHLVWRAAGEVAVPVASGVAIIALVFLPLLTLEGLEGKMFAPVALTIVFALVSALLLSLSAVPVIGSALLRRAHGGDAALVRLVQRTYDPMLGQALRHQRIFMAGAVLLLLVAGWAYTQLGKSFMPTLDEGDIIVQLEKVPTISLAQSQDTDRRFQKRVLEAIPEVSRVVARTGSDELGLDPMGLNETDTFLVLKPRDEWRSPHKEAIVDQLREIAGEFPGINFTFTQPIEMRTSEMLSGVRGDVAIRIYGNELAQLGSLANQVLRILRSIDGNEDANMNKIDGAQYLMLDLKPEALGRHGMNVDSVADELRTLVEGQQAGIVLRAGRRIPILVRGFDRLQQSAALLEQHRIPTPDGDAVPLTSIAELSMRAGPIRIDREASARVAIVRSNVSGRDLVGFVDEAQARVAQEVKLPEGYRIGWGGQYENQQRASARLGMVLPVTLGVIVLLLYMTLGNVVQALLIVTTIPFAMVGGVLALLASGEYLSVPASVGFIALMGIAVLNGLVMVTYFNQLVRRGLPITEVVAQGARRRLRPVLMTASIAGLGLVPLLLATGPGSEVQRPLAIVVLGGLVSATAMTLLLLPGMYRALHGRFGFGEAGHA